MDPLDICRDHGGTASYQDLLKQGATRHRIARALEEGALIRPGRGFYSTPHADRVRQAERVWGLRRTCVTALRELELPYRTRDARLHLAIDGTRTFSGRHAVPARDVHLHFLRAGWETAATVLGALDVSARCLSWVDQLAAIDAALNRGLITRADLDALVATRSARADWLRSACNPGAQSPPETMARVAMADAGIPLASQVPIPHVGRVDFVVDDAVVVEVDGRTYHMNERSFSTDRARDRQAQIAGYMPLRFTREDVELRRATMVDQVRAALDLSRRRRGLAPLRTRPYRARPGRQRS